MPTFCRHNRFLEKCPICSKTQSGGSSSRSAPRRAPRPAASGRSPSRGTARGLVVRQMARAPDDGYEHDLVPGLRSSQDARRLAEELAFAAARVDELRADPPGLYAEVAAAGDPEEAAWLAFLIAYVSPAEGEDPWAGVQAARVPWATGEIPALGPDVPLGPRTGHLAGRGEKALVAYRQWASRAGSQAQGLRGDVTWTPQRRFDRAMERISFLPRAARYEFLVLAGTLGLAEMEPSTLHLSFAGATDPIAVAAKRVFGIGDVPNLARRSADLVAETQVGYAAVDLGLQNWMRQPGDRITAASRAAASPERAASIAAALGIELQPANETRVPVT